MVESAEQCREGWDPSDLLAYLEGDLPIEDRRELEHHLKSCEACSRELESLRRVDSMLTAAPQVFHPDEEALYRYVSAGQDDEGRVSAHLETCEQCREEAAIFREMVAIGPNLSKPQKTIPRPLLKNLEKYYLAAGSRVWRGRLFSVLLELLRKPFDAPMFSVGTVAAALMIVALLVPAWITFQGPPLPEAVPPSDSTARPAGRESREFSGGPAAPSDAGSGAPVQPRLRRESQEPKPAPGAAALSIPVPARKFPELEKVEPEKRKGLSEEPAPSAAPRSAPSKWQNGKFPYLDNQSRPRVGEQAPSTRQSPDRASRLFQRKGGSGRKATVVVQVFAPADLNLQGLKFVSPRGVEGKYNFVEQISPDEELARNAEKPRSPAGGPPDTEARRIIIRIGRIGPPFSLEGTLFEPGSHTAGKTVTRPNVAPKDLQVSISSMVGALLQED